MGKVHIFNLIFPPNLSCFLFKSAFLYFLFSYYSILSVSVSAFLLLHSLFLPFLLYSFCFYPVVVFLATVKFFLLDGTLINKRLHPFQPSFPLNILLVLTITLMCISKNVNNIVYPCKICHVNINNKDSAALHTEP